MSSLDHIEFVGFEQKLVMFWCMHCRTTFRVDLRVDGSFAHNCPYGDTRVWTIGELKAHVQKAIGESLGKAGAPTEDLPLIARIRKKMEDRHGRPPQ
jgi:hypothetical protein